MCEGGYAKVACSSAAEIKTDTFRVAFDEDGRISDWCTAAMNMTGLVGTEAYGMKLNKLVEEDDVKIMALPTPDCRACEAEVAAQTPLWSNNGIRTIEDLQVKPDSTGQGVILTGRVVQDEDTEVLRACRAIHIGVSNQGHVTHWNAAAETVSGYTRAEVLGAQISIILEDDCVAATMHAIHLAVSQEGSNSFPCYFFEASGKRHDVILRASARYDSSGEVVGVDIKDSAACTS